MSERDEVPNHIEAIAAVGDRLISPVAVIAPDSSLRYINPAGAHALGQEPNSLTGKYMLELIHPEDRPRVRVELRQVVSGQPSAGSSVFRLRADPSRDWRVFESTVDNLLDDDTVNGLLVSSRDITDQVERDRALHEAAYSDPLTGLPNRRAVRAELRDLVGASVPLAVLFVSVHRMDMIRNWLGHLTADAVVQGVALRVRGVVPASMLVGQFGADVFAIVLTDDAARDARDLSSQIVERIGEPMFVAGHELRLDASVGVAHGHATATPDSLLHDAGIALHATTTHGDGRVEVFEQEMRERAVARQELEADLRRAHENDELWIALQPIVRLADAVPVRVEALLRWDRDGEAISPCTFIPIAEETGLIVPIGDRTIELAASRADRVPGSQILINLSPRQLAAPGLPERIIRILDAHQLSPSALGFEVTETMVIEHFDYAAEVIGELRQLGCAVGLDDFGTGYSSLSYLRRLPLDFIKIDGELTSGVDSDREARAIVSAIVTMADALGLDVIAERVETESQARALTELGCAQGQGYYFGHPARPQ